MPARPPTLALLSNGVSPHNDNHARIVTALTRAGWEIAVFRHGELGIYDAKVCADRRPLDGFDLVWMLGLGEQHDFLDRCQILANLPSNKLVNAVQGTLLLHSKHIVLPHAPLTFSGNSATELLAATQAHPDIERWVVKPAAGSYGRGVASAANPDTLRELLQQATRGHRYCILQAWVNAIQDGETRTIVVNGRPIGSYQRIPDHSFLANLSQGARAHTTQLSTQQTGIVDDISAKLLDHGIRFAAIDTAGPWLIEVNVANPGGLATLMSLEGAKTPNIDERLAAAMTTLLPAR